jgi:predicted nuclease of predicted toxin-antitoxin system
MEVRLLLDANLSWRSIAVLKHHFDDCIHIDSTELSVPARDTAIWEYAGQKRFVIVTNDDDFFNLYAVKGFPPKVIMLRTGNQSRKFIV